MVGEEVTKEQPGVRTKLGKGFGGEPAIVVEKFQRGKEGQPREKARGEPEIYDLPKNVKRMGDAQTLFGQIQRALDVMGNSTERGVALREEEFKAALDLISETSGGGREYRWELGQFMGQMIIDASKDKEDPEKIWKTLVDPNTNAKDRELLRQQNPEMTLIVDYLVTYGASPEKVNWGEVLVLGEAIEAIKAGKPTPDRVWEVLSQRSKDPAKALAEMKKKTWKDKETQLKALENMLGMHQKEIQVDVMGFWKKEFLKVVEARLESMRSPVSAWLNPKPDKNGIKYLDITRSRDVRKPKHEGDRVYASRLAICNLAGNTLLGGFLDEMHRGEFWRGKADLDYLYWSLYMGQFIDDEKAQEDERMHDIFARLKADDVMESGLRGYSGPNTLSRLAKDPLFVEALQQLYTVPGKPGERLNQEERLNKLATKYRFDQNKDLPTWVTDAVMLSQVFALDARHLTSSDRRYTVYFLAEYYKEAAVKLKDKRVAEFWGGKNGVIEMLGFNFRFTETPLVKGWFIDPLNMDVNYHAFADDDRQFDPEKYPDQLDKVWQNMFMFCLEGRKDSLRRLLEKDVDVSYSVGPGQGGEYCGYDNDRWIQKKGKERVFDHRREVYKHFGEMFDEDAELLLILSRRGRGKAGWDEDLRKDVKTTLGFLQSSQSITIDGVTIETNGEEIFYNDQLAKLLDRYEEVRNTPQAANQFSSQDIENLENFLTMRNVLRDQRAWGWVYSLDLNESDMFNRLEQKKDLMLATLYDMAGGPAKDAMRKLINVPPFQTMGEMPITPASILAAALEFGHRYQKVQFYPTLFKVYQFAETCLMMRMSQLEIPDAQTLAKAIDPTGDIRFGVWGEEFKKVLGPEWQQLFKDQKALWEVAADLGFLEKMVLLETTLAEKGFYEMYDSALEIEVLRLVLAEALQWQHQRDIPLKQRGGIQRYIARYRNKYRVVARWEMPDVTFEKREKGAPLIIRHDLGMEDLTPYEIKTFCKIISNYEEAGLFYGGVREGLLKDTGGLLMFDDIHEKSTPIKDASGSNKTVLDDKPLAIFQETYDAATKTTWFLVGTEKDAEGNWQSEGWIKCDRQNLEMRDQARDIDKTPIRQGEVMLDGGRLYFDGEIWHWRKGYWDLPARDEDGKIVPSSINEKAETISNVNVFFLDEEKGFERLRRLKISDGAERIEYVDIGWNGEKGGFSIETQIKKEEGKVEEVIEPLVVFDGLEKRLQFLVWRKQMTYRVLFGYSKESVPGGQAMVELGQGFKDKTAEFTQVFRWANFVLGQLRIVKRRAGYKQILIARAKEDFGLEIMTPQEKIAGGIIEQRMVPTQLGIQQELFPEDIELVEKYRRSLNFWGILLGRKGDFWKEKGRLMTAIGGVGRTIWNKTLVGIYRTLNLNLEKIPFIDVKLPFKINVPVNLGYIFVIAKVLEVAPWKLGAFFTALKIAPWQFLVVNGIPWAILNGLVPYVGTQLTNWIYVKAREEVNKLGDYEKEIELGLAKFKPAI